jgi:hypothetical protein
VNMIMAIVLRNKTNQDRYLAASMDVGDWEDENLDVTIDHIQNAYLIIRKDLSIPTIADFEEHKTLHARHKQYMIDKFGEDALIGLDFEGACEHYEPVNIEITQEQYDYSKELAEESA